MARAGVLVAVGVPVATVEHGTVVAVLLVSPDKVPGEGEFGAERAAACA